MVEQIQKCVEKVIEEFTVGDYFREIYEAKKNYFENVGTVAEDDPDFENRMDLFMGWYLFDRPLNVEQLSPVQLYFRKNMETFPPGEKEIYKSLTETVHSVYELMKERTDGLLLRDVGSGDKLEVEERKMKLGFSKGDIFEARLIPLGKKYAFANGFCFHPKEAFKFIESQMKKVRTDDQAQRTKLLLKFGQMVLKHQKFPHIDAQYIYTLTPKF